VLRTNLASTFSVIIIYFGVPIINEVLNLFRFGMRKYILIRLIWIVFWRKVPEKLQRLQMPLSKMYTKQWDSCGDRQAFFRNLKNQLPLPSFTWNITMSINLVRR
jgi:hypothetical protein